MISRPTAIGLASGLAAASIWGAMFVVSKAILPVIPAFTLLSLRLLLGVVALALLWWWRRPTRTAESSVWQVSRWWPVFGAGVVGYGISLGLQFWGTAQSTASNASLVTCATPAFLVLFAIPLLGQKMTVRDCFGLLLAILGVVSVLEPSWTAFDMNAVSGNLALVGAALTWGLYTILTARVARGLDLTLSSLVGFLGGLPLSLAGSAWELAHNPIGTIDLGIIAGVLFLGLVSTAIAMLLWNHAFQVLPASTAGLTFFAQPVVGTLLGSLFLGESPSGLFYLGAALIGLALFLGRRP